MYLHQKMIRIYSDIVQNHTLPGVFPNFWRAVYVYTYEEFVLVTEAPECNRMTATRQDTDNKKNNIQIFKIDNVQNSKKHNI